MICIAKARNEAVDGRVFTNVYVCMKCNTKIRSGNLKKAKCRNCNSKSLRLKHKQSKSAS
ncbi:50S ribosomal protein L40e [archaeon]|nr:50S ribosomal protein L40e [archaeon]